FQIHSEQLFEIARGSLLLQERQRVALFTRKDVFERFVACYVYVPRDRYTPDFKERAKQILEEAFDGRETQVYDHVTDSPLARGLFVVRTTPGKVPDIDVKRVEAYLADAARTWSDRLLESLTQHYGEEAGIDLHRRYKRAFPMAYAERFSAAAALYDIGHVEEILAGGELVVDLYRHRSEQRQFHCKIIHAGPPVPLSEIMPRLENMGLKVLNEVPYEVQPLGAPHPVRIRDFSLSADGMQDDLGPVKEKFQEAFVRVWNRQAEIEDALEDVRNPDEDRILRLYVTLMEATLRTNYWQRSVAAAASAAGTSAAGTSAAGASAPEAGAATRRKPYLSFKLDSQQIR